MNKLLQVLAQRRDLTLTLIVLVALFITAVIISPGQRFPKEESLGFMTVTLPKGWPIFLTLENLTDILRTNAIIGVMALGMTLVILTAGIDLSVGSILLLASVVTGLVIRDTNAPWIAAVALGIFAGTVVGALNGALIAKLKVQPFIITLATMIGIRGLAKMFSNNKTVLLPNEEGTQGYAFIEIVASKWVTIGSFVVLAAVFALLLWGTVFGRYVRALGDNAKAADYAGLPTQRMLVAVYTLTGMLAGVAGVLSCALDENADSTQGVAAELDVIAVVVIGGTSLAGGRGSILGSVLGLLIIMILKNILGLNNIGSNEQQVIMAGVIILAVAAQMIQGSSLPAWLRIGPLKN